MPSMPGGTTPWQEWVQQVLEESYSGAPQDRCGVVAYAIARAVRFIGNEAVGTLRYAPEVAAPDVHSALSTVTEEVCRLVGAWSCKSAADTKHAHILVYAVDLMMQVPFPPTCSCCLRSSCVQAGHESLSTPVCD